VGLLTESEREKYTSTPPPQPIKRLGWLGDHSFADEFFAG